MTTIFIVTIDCFDGEKNALLFSLMLFLSQVVFDVRCDCGAASSKDPGWGGRTCQIQAGILVAFLGFEILQNPIFSGCQIFVPFWGLCIISTIFGGRVDKILAIFRFLNFCIFTHNLVNQQGNEYPKANFSYEFSVVPFFGFEFLSHSIFGVIKIYSQTSTPVKEMLVCPLGPKIPCSISKNLRLLTMTKMMIQQMLIAPAESMNS